SQTAGTSSAPQTVTVANAGTSAMQVQSVTSPSDFFTVTGFTSAVTLNPGESIQLSVTFNPMAPQTYSNAIDIAYDMVPDNGVSLSGTGTVPASIAITSPATLAAGVQGALYLANLQATSSQGKVGWSLQAGSVLPAGLTLTNTGVISGTISSTVAPG